MKEKAEIGMQNAELRGQLPIAPKEALPLALDPKLSTNRAAPGSRLPTPIELHIEELVIHGFAPNDHQQLAAAVEHELTRLLDEKGFGQALTDEMEIERLHGGAFRIRQDEPSTTTGQQLAGTIYKSINSISGGTRK